MTTTEKIQSVLEAVHGVAKGEPWNRIPAHIKWCEVYVFSMRAFQVGLTHGGVFTNIARFEESLNAMNAVELDILLTTIVAAVHDIEKHNDPNESTNFHDAAVALAVACDRLKGDKP